MTHVTLARDVDSIWRMRWGVRILLGVGAAASIATTVASWTASATAELPPATIDDQHLSLRYLVHVTWGGDEAPPPGNLYGKLTATPATKPTQPYNVIVEARNLRLPDAVTTTTVPMGTETSFLTDAPLWDTCDTVMCSEDFEVVVRRPFAPGLVVDIAGTFDASTHGIGGSSPPGDLMITVEGPL